MIWFQQKLADIGGGKLLALAGFVISAGLIYLVIKLVEATTTFVRLIEDSTERGLAYIAIAIVIHAFLGKSNTTVSK